MNLKSNEVIMIVGMRGMGKSTLLEYQLRLFQARGVEVFVYDPLAEHGKFPRYIPKILDDIVEFDAICEKIWEKGNIVFAIEEVDLYANPHQISPMLKRIISVGRHRNIGLICISRRIWDVHKLICSQAHHWFIFRSIELGYAINYMKQFIGESALKLKALQPYQFLYWSRGQTQIFDPITV